MAVNDTSSTTRVNGDGAILNFTFNFPVKQETDLVVKKIVNATEVATLQVLNTDYTVSLNTVTEGGTVTYTTAPLATEDSFIKRTLTLNQGTVIPTESNFPEITIENELDRSRMIDIQINEEADRAITFAETSVLSNVNAPEGTSASNRALKIWGWNAAGTNLELYAATIIDAVSVITAKGDIVQGSDTSVAERLGIGSTGGLLVVTSGKLAYLAIGSANEVLKVSSGTPAWGVPTIIASINYRSGLNCKYASTTTITIEAGILDVDGTEVEKTSDTTLNITTDAHWIGGSSLQAVSTGGFIYADASGNLLMHTTAPNESDTSGNTSGTLRYNDHGGATDYRCIGWFYMNATGSGELSSYEVGNLADGVSNSVTRTDSVQNVVNDTVFGTDLTNTQVHFYTVGQVLVKIQSLVNGSISAGMHFITTINDGSDIVSANSGAYGVAADSVDDATESAHAERYSQGFITFEIRAKVTSGIWTVEEKTIIISEGGV